MQEMRSTSYPAAYTDTGIMSLRSGPSQSVHADQCLFDFVIDCVTLPFSELCRFVRFVVG
jgi:hypothetical protein